MREDMYKVIVERPRRWKDGDAAAARLRNDFDGPSRLGMRAGYGYRELNENLAPLRRYLHAQIGRPWNTVFSEICARIDRRNAVQRHIHEHIRNFIDVCGGGRGVFPALYVDPRNGLIRRNKNSGSWRRRFAEGRRRIQAEIAARRRIVDERTQLLLLHGAWFSVVVDVLPEARLETRYDAVLRRNISRAMFAESEQRQNLYGSTDLYAVSKRQMSTREIKANRLR